LQEPITDRFLLVGAVAEQGDVSDLNDLNQIVLR